MKATKYIQDRKRETESRFVALQENLIGVAPLMAGKASVYATGSFGRGEASRHSDLDLFIVGRRHGVRKLRRVSDEEFLLRRLDEIVLKAELIKVTKSLDIPEFDGDGKYLVQFSIETLIEFLGTPQDDSSNTFTARLLMLLEGKPLLNEEFYADAVREVIGPYWRDFGDHTASFMPAYLTNDILRLWRTLCVNYEARTQDTPAGKKIERKLKNYKLRYSRILTCFSSILVLIAEYERKGTVSIDDAVSMVSKTPVERILYVKDLDFGKKANKRIDNLVGMYADFLEETSVSKAEMLEKFSNPPLAKELAAKGREFGDRMHDVLHTIAPQSSFYRMLVV